MPQQRPASDPGYGAGGARGGYAAGYGGYPRPDATGGFPRPDVTGGFPRPDQTGGFPRPDAGRPDQGGGYPANPASGPGYPTSGGGYPTSGGGYPRQETGGYARPVTGLGGGRAAGQPRRPDQTGGFPRPDQTGGFARPDANGYPANGGYPTSGGGYPAAGAPAAGGAFPRPDQTGGFPRPDQTGGFARPNGAGATGQFRRPDPGDHRVTGEFRRPDQTGGFSRPDPNGGYPGSGYPRPDQTGGFPRPDQTGGFPRPDQTGGFPRPDQTGEFRRPGGGRNGGYPQDGLPTVPEYRDPTGYQGQTGYQEPPVSPGPTGGRGGRRRADSRSGWGRDTREGWGGRGDTGQIPVSPAPAGESAPAWAPTGPGAPAWAGSARVAGSGSVSETNGGQQRWTGTGTAMVPPGPDMPGGRTATETRPDTRAGTRTDGRPDERTDSRTDSRTEGRPVPASEPPPSQSARNTARRVILTLWFAGLAFPIWLWWSNTVAIDGTGAILVAAGRLTGLVAGYTLLTQIVLMARLPGLQRAAGAERMLKWHRDIGALLTVTVIAHALLLVEGYAVFSGASAIDEGLRLFNEQADMVGAFAAAGMLTALALLSIRQLRKKLSYELWIWIHRSAYAVLYLGYAHQFSAGEDIGQGTGKIYWAGLHILAVGTVIWGRVGVPFLINMFHRVRVAEVVDEGGDTISIYMSGNRLDQLGARSGQYLRWRFLQGGLISQSHPFSLSAPPNSHWLRITVKTVGSYTSKLRDLQPETRVWVSAPEGEHTPASRTANKAVLISAGSGIAPARAMLPELPGDTVVVFRASTEADLVLRAELEEITRARGGKLHVVTGSRTETGPKKLLTSWGLADLVPDIAMRDIYLCGPPDFAKGVVTALRPLNVPKRQIHVSAFEL